MYNLIISTLLLILMPPRLRKELMTAMLESLSVPLQTVIDNLVVFRIKKSYEMALNAQIIYLEKMLNDKFNAEGSYTDIYITDNLVTDERVYIGQPDEEDSAVYFGHVWSSGISNADAGDEFIFDDKTWQSLVDDNTTDPEEGLNWTEVAADEIVYFGLLDEFAALFTFTVHIVAALYASIESRIPEMSSYLEKYKLLGTKYNYEII